jgi:hypothetical protein
LHPKRQLPGALLVRDLGRRAKEDLSWRVQEDSKQTLTDFSINFSEIKRNI